MCCGSGRHCAGICVKHLSGHAVIPVVDGGGCSEEGGNSTLLEGVHDAGDANIEPTDGACMEECGMRPVLRRCPVTQKKREAVNGAAGSVSLGVVSCCGVEVDAVDGYVISVHGI